MTNGLFVRPNLKLFLGGALLFLLVVQLFSSGQSTDQLLLTPLAVSAANDPQARLRALLNQAIAHPNADTYTQLCLYYERAGNFRKALYYLRLAEQLAQMEQE